MTGERFVKVARGFARVFRGGVVLVVAAVLMIPPDRVRACQICFPIPKRSVADDILEADLVVVAREDPQKPFSCIPTEVLRGELGDAEIDVFLDSQTRRLLTLFPERGVLCVYESTGIERGWRRIGMVDEVTRPVVAEILDRAEQWRGAPESRLAYFASLLGHTNDQLRSLAHIEVARAPYAQIRHLGGAVPREELRGFLGNNRYAEWHALYILLLAQSVEQEDEEYIVDRVETAEKYGVSHQLAAWAAALIERRGEEALGRFEKNYLTNTGRRAEEISEVLSALSVHGNREPGALRDAVVDAYRETLEHHPGMAAPIVTDLVAWERWDLSEEVAAVVSAPPAEMDLAVILQLRAYLGGVNEGAEREEEKEGNVMLLVVLGGLVLVPVVLGVLGKCRKG